MLKMPLTGNRGDPKSKNIRRDVDDVDPGALSVKERLVVFVFSGLLLAICIVFLIVGIVYLTGNFYQYSFTRFSTTLVAGLFIAFGVVMIGLVVLNVYLVSIGRGRLVAFTTILSVILLTVLFAIGIWGLSVATGPTFIQTVRQGMTDTIQYYQFDNQDNFATRKFDWLQRTFNCCGIDSYQDWKGFYLYGQTQNAVGYEPYGYNAYLLAPSTVSVPDSCCFNNFYQCGRTHYQYAKNSDQSKLGVKNPLGTTGFSNLDNPERVQNNLIDSQTGNWVAGTYTGLTQQQKYQQYPAVSQYSGYQAGLGQVGQQYNQYGSQYQYGAGVNGQYLGNSLLPNSQYGNQYGQYGNQYGNQYGQLNQYGQYGQYATGQGQYGLGTINLMNRPYGAVYGPQYSNQYGSQFGNQYGSSIYGSGYIPRDVQKVGNASVDGSNLAGAAAANPQNLGPRQNAQPPISKNVANSAQQQVNNPLQQQQQLQQQNNPNMAGNQMQNPNFPNLGGQNQMNNNMQLPQGNNPMMNGGNFQQQQQQNIPPMSPQQQQQQNFPNNLNNQNLPPNFQQQQQQGNNMMPNNMMQNGPPGANNFPSNLASQGGFAQNGMQQQQQQQNIPNFPNSAANVNNRPRSKRDFINPSQNSMPGMNQGINPNQGMNPNPGMNQNPGMPNQAMNPAMAGMNPGMMNQAMNNPGMNQGINQGLNPAMKAASINPSMGSLNMNPNINQDMGRNANPSMNNNPNMINQGMGQQNMNPNLNPNPSQNPNLNLNPNPNANPSSPNQKSQPQERNANPNSIANSPNNLMAQQQQQTGLNQNSQANLNNPNLNQANQNLNMNNNPNMLNPNLANTKNGVENAKRNSYTYDLNYVNVNLPPQQVGVDGNFNFNTRGCLHLYIMRYQKDLQAAAGICFGLSLFGIFLCAIFIGILFFIRRRQTNASSYQSN